MSEIATPARCGICNKVFYGPKAALIGANLGTREAQVFFQSLVDHLMKSHPNEFMGCEAAGAEYKGMLIVSYFAVNDPDLQKMCDISRWNVLQKVLAARVSDEHIAQSVDGVLPDLCTLVEQGDRATLRKNLITLLQGMRNAIEERGKYDLAAMVAASRKVV